jgi:preprotein translocase subunit SecE
MKDVIKLWIAIGVMAAGILGFYYFEGHSLLLRVIGLLVVAGMAAAIAYRTSYGRSAWAFAVDARNEVRKVVWPTRKETTQTTMVVISMVILMAIVLWIFDWFLALGIAFLTGRGS